MRVFIAAVLFATVAAVGMSFVLDKYQRDSYAVFTTDGVRVGDPGHNLVGPG